MKKNGWIILLFVFVLASCQKAKPDRAMVVAQLRDAAKLSSTEFVVSKVLMAKKQKEFIGINIGREATFMTRTKAYIKAGVDLDKLKAKDIEITDQRISILLPKVEITNFSYPAEEFETVVKYSDEGFWNHFNVRDKDKIFRYGESSIRESLSMIGLQKEAEVNTRKFFEQVLKQLGFNEIYIEFK